MEWNVFSDHTVKKKKHFKPIVNVFNQLDTKSYISKSRMNQRERLKKKKPIELNEKGNKAYQILWDTAKEVLRGEIIYMKSYTEEQESQ